MRKELILQQQLLPPTGSIRFAARAPQTESPDRANPIRSMIRGKKEGKSRGDDGDDARNQQSAMRLAPSWRLYRSPWNPATQSHFQLGRHAGAERELGGSYQHERLHIIRCTEYSPGRWQPDNVPNPTYSHLLKVEA